MQQLLIDNFSALILSEFKEYCVKYEIEATQHDFLIFLLDKKLLDNNAIHKYAVIKEYAKISSSPDFKKTKAVKFISKKYNVTDRTIWNILSTKKG